MAALLVLLFFSASAVQPAKPGKVQPAGNYVLAPEGVFRIENGRVLHAPEEFHPAFVFLAEPVIRPAEKGSVSVISADAKSIQVRYSVGVAVREGTSSTLTAIHTIDSAFAVSVPPSSDQYLLIRWRGDTSSCAVAFTLFKIYGNTLKETATNAYGCDL